jgi:hypothetical protein
VLSVVDVSTAEVEREVDLGGEPLKLELHDSAVVVTNPSLGILQRVPLHESEPQI